MAIVYFPKMLFLNFIILLIVDQSLSLNAAIQKSCDCYDSCSKNFTTNSIKDIEKIAACQRGCRFYTLVLHTSHEKTLREDSHNAKYGCLLSCSEGYKKSYEIAACNSGCLAVKTNTGICSPDNLIPQVSYSLLIEESDVLIRPGESDPDDVLTDPGLRKQFEKTVEVFLDSKPKLPEIHFTNLPVKNQKPVTEYSHVNFKCPKFYGLDSKFEFRNGKIIIGDLYLFMGVFIFVVICFLLGHYIETKTMTKQMGKSRLTKKEEIPDKEPLLKTEGLEDHCNFITEKEPPPEYSAQKPHNDVYDPIIIGSDSKFENITLVFHDDDGACNDKKQYNYEQQQ